MSARDVIGRAIHGQEFADGRYILVDSILEDLAAAGFAVVKLPEPDHLCPEDAAWVTANDEVQIDVCVGDLEVSIKRAGRVMPYWTGSAAEARAFAAALLAAASLTAHAEAGDSDD